MERKQKEMISVIVPVYNVEKYLDECVQSILSQTYTDYELILVDDGSTDKSGIMCDEYAQRDNRVKVIHKDNGGLSDARNKGTEKATGGYLTYIDSDDYVSGDYLETMWSLVKKNQADIAVTGIEKFYDGDKIKGGKRGKPVMVLSAQDALIRVLYQDGMDTSACALLIKREIAIDNQFPIGRYHEDDYTTYKYYLDAKIVACSSLNQYYYRQRRGSIMHSFGKASIDELEAADNLVEALSRINVNLERAAESKRFSNYCQVILDAPNLKEHNPDVYMRINTYLNNQKLKILTDQRARKKNKYAAALLCVGGLPLLRLVNRVIKRY